ncbi:WecB/TagA/CpsF family glycosyltransferase [Gallaecimonas sp. GXIMD1310]|uniref:WecB/TagA/CpsF family glycosyltransferase n=1 Tax=Gallaecimonas sp. GXIMD1310 TaxID=3131926 RepID=UPI0032500B5C
MNEKKAVDIIDSKIQSSDYLARLYKKIEFDRLENSFSLSFLNPYSYFKILECPNVSYLDIDHFLIDGSLLCFFDSFFNGRKTIRYSFDFSSLADPLLSYFNRKRYNVAAIGGTSSEISKFVEKIEIKYPGLNLKYQSSGYFGDELLDDVSKVLIDRKVDIVILGLGTPKQEYYASVLKKKIPKGVFFLTCGGFISQTARKMDYYHPIVKRLGLRWLQRFLMEPHVRKRLIFDYPSFVVKYIKLHMKR